MIKKITLIISVVFIAQTIIVACCGSDCPELPPKYLFSHESLKVDNLDNSGKDPFVTNSDVLKEAYGIRLTFTLNRLANNAMNIRSIFSSAYACDCEEERTLQPQDTISSVTIITNSDFNNTTAAGSDVAKYFVKGSSTNLYNTPDSDYYKGHYDILKNTQTIDLFLLTPPTLPGSYSFTININFSDGRVITTTTQPVTLN